MKANSKIRRQVRNDDRGVSSVIGTLLMVSIVVAIIPVVMIAMGNLTNKACTMMDVSAQGMNATAQTMIIATEYMKSVADYLQKFQFGQGGDNNSTTPDVESEFNETTGEWQYFVYQNHTWVELIPYWPGEQTVQGEQEILYTLTVVVVPAGRGSVTKNPQHTCYFPNATVELNATASPGWCFMHWSGDLNGTTNPTTITMNSNKTIYATFNMIMG